MRWAKMVLLVLMFSFAPRLVGQSSSSSAGDHASVSATPVMQYTLPPDKLQKAHALYRQGELFQILDPAYGFLLLMGLLYFGVVAWFRDWAERASQRRWVQGLMVLPLFVIASGILSIPMDVYHHHIGLAYGLSVQGWGSWWADWGKGLFLSILLETLLLSLLYLMIRCSPRRWWFYGWLIVIPVVIFVTFIEPVIVEPMFFKFSPLEQANPELTAQIERVTKRGGLEIPRSRMYSMEASEKYTGDNAYVSGFGASKRVVVWDTTQKHMSNPQIMFVFGHEMGHYVLHHTVKGMVLLVLFILLLLYLAYRAFGWMLRRWGARWQIREIGDWASVPVLILLLGIFNFIANPVGNAISRYFEHQADTYGLEVTHGLYPDSKLVAAQSFQILGENWLDYPGTSDLYEWWAFDHPATRKRLVYAQEYDPWAEGKEPEFVKGPSQ